VKAYEEVAQKEGVEWILLSSIGTALKQFDAPFSPAVYGYKDLPTLVQSCTDLFLTRRQTAGKTKHVEVWLVTGK